MEGWFKRCYKQILFSFVSNCLCGGRPIPQSCNIPPFHFIYLLFEDFSLNEKINKYIYKNGQKAPFIWRTRRHLNGPIFLYLNIMGRRKRAYEESLSEELRSTASSVYSLQVFFVLVFQIFRNNWKTEETNADLSEKSMPSLRT